MSRDFIITKEHRRFKEFANAVRKERTIGICHGDAGVGKTQSGRRYARWDLLEPFLVKWGPRTDGDAARYAAASRSRTLFYTPSVLPKPAQLIQEIDHLQGRLGICIDEHLREIGKITSPLMRGNPRDLVELLIVDEAERLNSTALEILRDRHDRQQIAVVFIGMPGIDKRFRHYPQLYSRIGFSHRYRNLARDELLFVLTRQWKVLGRTLDPEEFTDAQAIACIERITRGNFRLLERLFPQIGRVLRINDLETITDDVIEAAASTLVIGA